MKKMRNVMLVMICFVLAVSAASASETLSASIKGNQLVINWDVNCGGTAILTVYENKWPIDIRYVNCDDGEAVVNLYRTGGTYSIRLKTDTSCLTAGVTVAGNTPVPEVTNTPVVTNTPEATNAPVVTSAPEATATPVITASPTVAITPGPTVAITPVPTVNATNTPVPTAIVTPVPTSNTGSSQSGLAQQVVSQVNAERAKYGLSALRVDSELTRAACVRAAEIVEKFSHTRPDGSSWSTVSSSAYGENIAKGQKTADKVMAAWLTSEGHRANILRESFGSIGVCAYVYNGVTYWVQLFGR